MPDGWTVCPKHVNFFVRSGAKHMIVFATGGMPNSAVDTLEEMWRNNLTADEMKEIPPLLYAGRNLL